MRVGLKIFTSPKLDNLNIARDFLLRKGLVPSLDGDPDILVWEDELGVGRYVVHFDKAFKKNGKSYDLIFFKYWQSSRKVKRKILELDPMNSLISELEKELKKPFIYESYNCSIENYIKNK